METNSTTSAIELSSRQRGPGGAAILEPTPVVIIDTRRIVIDLLERALQSAGPRRFVVVGRASRSEDITPLLNGRQARILVLREEESDWVAVIRRFRRAWPRCSCLVVTERPELEVVGEAASVGAQGLVTSNMGADALIDAVAALAAGQTAFSPSASAFFGCWTSASRHAIANGEPMPELRESLRPAERNALLAYARLGTIADAAAALGKSRLTIRNNVDGAREKLGAANRVQAIWFALRRGAIEAELEDPTSTRVRMVA